MWVYFLVGVLGVAWFLKRRADAKAAQAGPDDQSVALDNSMFPNAQPMNYSSDIFINMPTPIPGSGGGMSTQPPGPPVIRPPSTTPAPPSTQPPGPPVIRPAPLPSTVPKTNPNPTPPSTQPIPVPKPKTKSISYVVKPGDTLWDIAKKYLGSGSRYSQIYTLNKTLIEAEARKHGFANSNSGARIWGGEKLVIPVG